MALTVADIIQVLETIAPAQLAEQWDNIGLQVGKRDRPVNTIRVALDPLPEVISAACEQSVDLLVTHHPLIFQPVKSLDFDTPLGRVLEMATRHELAILSAHTNLDTTTGGLNDLLAEKIGLRHLSVLGDSRDPDIYQLVLWVPQSAKQPVQALLRHRASAASDTVNRPVLCSTATVMTTQEPHTGPLTTEERGRLDGEWVRLETRIAQAEAVKVLREIRKVCSEGSLVYELYPSIAIENQQGLGRVGELEKGTDLIKFARSVKQKLGLKSVRVVGDPEMAVYKAAVCSGSGSGLLNAFFSTNAQVYITGDLRYHDAREAEAMNRGLIDIGHFASEHIIKEVLAERIRKRLIETGEDVRIETCRLETDPFMII